MLILTIKIGIKTDIKREQWKAETLNWDGEGVDIFR